MSRIHALYEDIIKCITEEKIEPETAISLVTSNVAKRLKLFPDKGTLLEGSDADILITDNNYQIKKLICCGKILVNNESTGGAE